MEEARGFITGYTITYDTTGARRKREVKVKEIPPDKSSVVIGGLSITESYYVILSASTVAGTGTNTVTTAQCELIKA